MKFFKDECGQGLAEYALILALIAIVVIAVLRALGVAIKNKLGQVENVLQNTNTEYTATPGV